MTDILPIPRKETDRAVTVHDKREFDQFAGNYNEALQEGLKATGESAEYFVRGRVRWIQRLLRELGERPKKALDFGCGTGGNSAALLKIEGINEVVGTDISLESLETARRIHNGATNIRFAGLDQIPTDASFDLAFCNGVFHHIPPAQRAAAMAKIGQWLRPGGLFAFWENNPWNPGTRYVMSRIPFDRDAITLTPPQSRQLVRDGGFEVLSTHFLFFFPRFLGWCRPIEGMFSRVPLGGQYVVLCRKSAAQSAAL
jgi:SAM-dependent methyltransferase